MKIIRKIILISIILLLVAGIFLFMCFNYVPILGHIIAEKRIEQYTGQPVEIEFDWYNGNYFAKINDHLTIRYDIPSRMLVVGSSMGPASERFTQMYHAFLESSIYWNDENGVYPKSLDVSTKVYTEDMKKTCYGTVIGVWDSFEGNEEETINHMLDMVTELNDYVRSEFYITSLKFIYGNYNYYYILQTYGRTKNIDEQNLRDFVHTDPEGPPLNYLEWKENANK